MSRTLLAGLTPDVFLRRHWQKRALLARQALPAARALLTREVLFRLATRDDVEARLVTHFGRRWEVSHGPFTRRALSRLPPRDWTRYSSSEVCLPKPWLVTVNICSSPLTAQTLTT